MLDAEIQIRPDKEESCGFDAGFQHLDVVGSGDKEVADSKSGNGADEEGPSQCSKLQCEPGERASEQVAADAAKGQGGEEESKADDRLIRDETFEVGVAEFPRLTDIGRENNEGGKAEKAEADALQQPKGGGTQTSAV